MYINQISTFIQLVQVDNLGPGDHELHNYKQNFGMV